MMDIDIDTILNTAESTLREGLRMGADEVEVYAIRARDVTAFVENNSVKHVKIHEPRGVGLRVLYRKRMGFASVNTLDNGSIGYALDTALKIAKVSVYDRYNTLPDPRHVDTLEGIYDDIIESFSVDDAVRYANDMLNTARGYDSRVTVDSGVFSASMLIHVICNSRGISLHERMSIFSCSIMGMAREGNSVSNFDVQSTATHRLKDIDVHRTASRFAENVVGTLDSKACEGFKGSMVLAPNATLDIIKEPLVFSVNAHNVQRNASRFSKMLGREVGSSDLTVIDDARLIECINASSFDREGVPTRRNVVIDKGTLKQFLHNSYTANRSNAESTGNASGSVNTPPLIDATNFIISPGSICYEDMIKEVKRGIIINRFSGNVNPVDGNFSGVVKGGYLIERGEVKHPVREVMVAGNVFDALKSISMVSKEQVSVMDSLLPYIVVDGVSFTV